MLAHRSANPPPRTARLNGEFDLDPELAIAWLDALLARPPLDLSLDPHQIAELLRARNELVFHSGSAADRYRPAELHPMALQSLQRLFRRVSEEQRERLAQLREAALCEPRSAPEVPLPIFLERFSAELWQAAFGITNLPANLSQAALFLDASYQSLPVALRVRLQGGQWELHDRNATARRNSRGKRAKARFPPRMALRARGVRLSWLTSGLQTIQARGGGIRIDVPGTKTVADGLRLARLNSLKAISQTAYGALPMRGVLGSNAVGLVLTMGPQAFVDARASGLFSHPTDKAAWERFAISSARSQSGNLAGVATSLVVGMGFVALGTVSAPALIAVGLVFGVLGQALFNAWGFDEQAEAAARSILGR
jgi:hypothetical protein